MTSDESLQFVEYLRRHNHLMTSAADGEPAVQDGPTRRQSKLLGAYGPFAQRVR